ncbi:hypothetical protein QTL95_28215 [Rhizobium sp. S152]|uniref:hypothetical protein n=1 Tax=Rhizobium sp. S152 TaxID=3055038 RepID=UPI0025AA15FE|nr:hypothetical protein [Rhizobium sp. S152]MDM9629773.1 hypothetical protein [Rhizobium sp. S152]
MAGIFDDLVPSVSSLTFDDLITDARPKPAQPSIARDIASSVPAGIARGAAETVMLPVTVNRLGEAAGDYLANGADHLVRAIFGLPARTAEDEARSREFRASSIGGKVNRAIFDAQDEARGFMDDHLYEPRTMPGKFAETVAEFAVPGGGPSRSTRLAEGVGRRAASYAGDLARNAIAPGVASEAAGQFTEGTSLEPYARVAGALVGNVGAAAASAASAPESALVRALGDPDAIDWDRAARLQDNGTGVRLTGAEAIDQAQGGSTSLPTLQRVVEGSVDGRSAMGPFFRDRPAQVDSAVGNVLDMIAPQSPNPSVLGPRASEAATNAIRDVEQARTAAVRPAYTAANAETVPEDAVQNILASIDSAIASDTTGIMARPLGELRRHLIAEQAQPGQPATRSPVTGPDGQVTRYTMTPAVPAVPERAITDIGNLDRVRKFFRDRMDLPQIGQDAITKEQNAAVTSILQQIDDAMTNASDNFAAGKQQYADITRETVQPIAEGPLGRVAAANTTGSAGDALMPHNPMTGSGDETLDAVRRLVAQDPDTTTGLVRQTLADRFARASTETQEGSREFAGAKFRKDVAGNQPRDELLAAIFRGLPDQAAGEAMPELLDVLQATGRRKPIGSATEFNRAANADLAQGSLSQRAANAIGSLGASFVTNAGDALKRAALGRNVVTLANLFTDPRSVQLIREAAARGAPNRLPAAAGRAAVQSTIEGQ